jgi:hypothetical protein
LYGVSITLPQKKENINPMNRIHLFEIEDLSWCPNAIRETSTDILFGLCNLANIYEMAYEKVAEIIDKTGINAIVDCCSGTGGPIKKLRNYLDQHQKNNVTITLTDKYPNIQSFEKLQKEYPTNIVGITQAVDATAIPSSLKGVRTFFSSFHHFKPEWAKQILQDAVNNEAPVAIFESTQRLPMDFVLAFLSPIAAWIILPFSKRLTFTKFIFTYLIPVSPLVFMWEYFISIFRTYSLCELQALTQKIKADDYYWEFGKLRSRKRKEGVVYMMGYKKCE